MPSLFPELYTFSLLSPLFLRLVAGFIFLDLGYLKFRGEKSSWLSVFETARLKPALIWLRLIALIEIVGGVLLIIGLYTQLAALILAILTFAELYVELKEEAILKRSLVFYTLIFVITLSLIFSGPGLFGIDYPL